MKVDSTIQLKEQQKKLEAALKKEDEITKKVELYQNMTLSDEDVPDEAFSTLADDLVELNKVLLELWIDCRFRSCYESERSCLQPRYDSCGAHITPDTDTIYEFQLDFQSARNSRPPFVL